MVSSRDSVEIPHMNTGKCALLSLLPPAPLGGKGRGGEGGGGGEW